MNISTAAIYLKHGYKVRRTSWDKDWFLYGDHYWSISICSEIPTFMENLCLEDLLADDWEIIND